MKALWHPETGVLLFLPPIGKNDNGDGLIKLHKNKKGTLMDAVQFPAGCWSRAEHLRLFLIKRAQLYLILELLQIPKHA
ncbi:hypothetical protein [Bacillus sp. ISL-55]|uniref:hypothetical protein n=1 Tax=Bacillus sp. ISL-55 TaxID=2819134 RepID=UPI001BE6A160|nr:hypothetical protein [Bacillus sp. ISL-55]MBT2691404.1 hypothetical protein [Bacillus sp. ISL-55]